MIKDIMSDTPRSLCIAYLASGIAICTFLLGLVLGEQRKYTKVNKAVTIVDNPKCLDGIMK